MHGAVLKANGHACIWRGQSKITVAKQRRKRDHERELLNAVLDRWVVLVAKILSYGQPTVFAFEGRCRTAIRVWFILERGLGWELSDMLAEVVIQRGLQRLGAKRPRWFECQREYVSTESRVSCAHCDRPILRSGSRWTIYCSEDCRLQAKNKRRYDSRREQNIEYARRRRDEQRAEAEIRTCEWCSLQFRPMDYANKAPQRFCSKTCRSRFASSCAAALRPYRLPSQRNRQGRFIPSA